MGDVGRVSDVWKQVSELQDAEEDCVVSKAPKQLLNGPCADTVSPTTVRIVYHTVCSCKNDSCRYCDMSVHVSNVVPLAHNFSLGYEADLVDDSVQFA